MSRLVGHVNVPAQVHAPLAAALEMPFQWAAAWEECQWGDAANAEARFPEHVLSACTGLTALMARWQPDGKEEGERHASLHPVDDPDLI